MPSNKQEKASINRAANAYGILIDAVEEAGVSKYPIAFVMRALGNVDARPDIVQAFVAAQLKLVPVGYGIYEASSYDNINVKEALDLIKGRKLRPAEDLEVDVYCHYHESQADIVLKPDSISTGVLFPGQAFLCFAGFASNVLERQTKVSTRKDLGMFHAYRVISPGTSYEGAISLLQGILPTGEIIATMTNSGGTVEGVDGFLDDWFCGCPAIIPVGDGSDLVMFWERFRSNTASHICRPIEMPWRTIPIGTVIATLSLH